MGNRGQVLIEDTGVTLYTHWNNHRLEEYISAALERGESRWDDPPYLGRIIFDEMVGEDQGETTGYGIDTAIYTDVNRVFVVSCDEQRVLEVSRGEARSGDYNILNGRTFEEFVAFYTQPETSQTVDVDGKTIVFTGSLPERNRAEATEIIEREGGNVTSAVSNNTDILVVGDSPGQAKKDDAENYNVNTVSGDLFSETLDELEREE